MMLLLFSGIRLGLSNLVFNVTFFPLFSPYPSSRHPQQPLKHHRRHLRLRHSAAVWAINHNYYIKILYMYTFEYYIRSPLNRPIHLPYRLKPVGQLRGFHLNNRHARIINNYYDSRGTSLLLFVLRRSCR